MATVTLSKVLGRVQVNNGQDASGNVRTQAINLGDLNENYFSTSQATAANKLLAVVGVLEPCLNATIEAVEIVEYSNVYAA